MILIALGSNSIPLVSDSIRGKAVVRQNVSGRLSRTHHPLGCIGGPSFSQCPLISIQKLHLYTALKWGPALSSFLRKHTSGPFACRGHAVCVGVGVGAGGPAPASALEDPGMFTAFRHLLVFMYACRFINVLARHAHAQDSLFQDSICVDFTYFGSFGFDCLSGHLQQRLFGRRELTANIHIYAVYYDDSLLSCSEKERLAV